MKRLTLGLLAVCLVFAASALSRSYQASPAPTAATALQVRQEERNPWTHLRVNNEPNDFQFAIVSDRTGGHRAEVFSRAVEQLNLMQPEFVLSVGDLIEGNKSDAEKLASEWREFDGYVAKLQMPFFYLPGNHDLSNATQSKIWDGKFGRRYYHFVYRDVLFLMLSSEDQPRTAPGLVGKEQLDYIRRTLEENKGVRWTVVALHKPLWVGANADKTGWLEVEKTLGDRPYTVFCGHVHRYEKFVRNGRNYYQLSTTGGSSKMRGVRFGEFDHIVWVTMKKNGPVLANVLLNGIYAEDMTQPRSTEKGVEVKRKPLHPVAGRVTLEGKPVENAVVAFYVVNAADKKLTRVSDGLSEADGSFQLSTYRLNDGAPVGEYVVTVELRGPAKAGLPERFAKTDTSGLRFRIVEGQNDFALHLTK